MDTKNWDTVFKNQESPFPNHAFFGIFLHMFCDITRKFALMLNLQQTMLPYHKLKRLEVSYSKTVNFERSCHQTSLSSHATACKNTATISLKIQNYTSQLIIWTNLSPTHPPKNPPNTNKIVQKFWSLVAFQSSLHMFMGFPTTSSSKNLSFPTMAKAMPVLPLVAFRLFDDKRHRKSWC